MTVVGRISKLAMAGAMIVAMASPSLADWVVVKAGGQCMLMEESAAEGEVRIAGPFATEDEAEKAKGEHPECDIEKN